MANLRELQRRMTSIKSTMQITRTMEMISTVRIGRALELAEEANPYKDAITRMLSHVAAAGGSNNPLLKAHADEKSVLFVLIASDRGLAGGFNIMQQRTVERRMRELERRGVSCSLITCGRKPTEYFTYRGVRPVMSFVGISAEPNMDEADRIASYVVEGYTSGSVDRVELLYWHAKSRMDQTPVEETLLPLSTDQLIMPAGPREHEAISTVESVSSDYHFEPSAREVLGYLVPAYLRTVIYHALLDSAAAEHGARRRAMRSATDNANEVLRSLSRTYNRTRQGAITTELNEIIGGASALEEH